MYGMTPLESKELGWNSFWRYTRELHSRIARLGGLTELGDHAAGVFQVTLGSFGSSCGMASNGDTATLIAAPHPATAYIRSWIEPHDLHI